MGKQGTRIIGSGSPQRWKKWLVALAVLWLAHWLLTPGAKAYLKWYDERQEVLRLKQQLAVIEDENEHLRQGIESLDTMSGREAEARRQGWIKPGETPVLIPEPQTEARAEPPPSENEQEVGSEGK